MRPTGRSLPETMRMHRFRGGRYLSYLGSTGFPSRSVRQGNLGARPQSRARDDHPCLQGDPREAENVVVIGHDLRPVLDGQIGEMRIVYEIASHNDIGEEFVE